MMCKNTLEDTLFCLYLIDALYILAHTRSVIILVWRLMTIVRYLYCST